MFFAMVKVVTSFPNINNNNTDLKFQRIMSSKQNILTSQVTVLNYFVLKNFYIHL